MCQSQNFYLYYYSLMLNILQTDKIPVIYYVSFNVTTSNWLLSNEENSAPSCQLQISLLLATLSTLPSSPCIRFFLISSSSSLSFRHSQFYYHYTRHLYHYANIKNNQHYQYFPNRLPKFTTATTNATANIIANTTPTMTYSNISNISATTATAPKYPLTSLSCFHHHHESFSL